MNGPVMTDGMRAFLDKFGIKLDDEDMHFEIRPLLYSVNSMRLRGFDEFNSNSYALGVGVSILALTELAERLRPPTVLLPDFLKAMSDNTKWTIMQKLKKESMYSGQLAESLNLTGATISHHMDTLKRLELIVYRKEGTKLYYNLNGEKVRLYLEELERALVGE